MSSIALYKRYFRLLVTLAIVCSVGTLLLGTWVDTLGVRLVGLTLQQLGTAGLVASTISLAFAEYYKSLRRQDVTQEIGSLVAELRFVIEDPSKIGNLEPVLNLREAGVRSFYVNRSGPAAEAMRTQLKGLRASDKKVTVRMMGDTLRVFFHPGSDFTPQVYELVTTKTNIHFDVLILDPLCLNAVYRSQAETSSPFTSLGDYKERSGLYHDSAATVRAIDEFNQQAKAARGQSPIRYRFYDCANFCLTVLFPDGCFTSQYLCARFAAQVQTVRLPMIVFNRDSEAWQRYDWHFRYVWRGSSSTDQLQEPQFEWPVSRCRIDEGANGS